MNSVQLIGRLTADPETRDTTSGAVCNLRLAIPRPKGRDGADRGADFVDVSVWGGQAASCGTYLARGRMVAVSGRLHHREWEAEDGSKRSRVQVVADNVQFLGAPNGNQPAPEAESEEL